MESPLLSLIVLNLWLILFALFVESAENVKSGGSHSQPAPKQGVPQSPSPLPSPSPSPQPPPTRHRSSPPPPFQSPAVPPPPRRHPPPLPPKGSHHSHASPPPKHADRSSTGSEHKRDSSGEHDAATGDTQKLNLGKTVGLVFLGIAAILQICVVVFLVIKRRQLLQTHGSF